MDANARRTLAPMLAVLALASLAGCPGPGEDDPADAAPFPAKGGIKQNLSLASLTSASGGWTVCDLASSTYSDSLLDFVPPMNGCGGTYMMLACGEDGSDTLTLAAADLITVVMTDDSVYAPPHVANGVGWYFDPALSIGFAPAGAAINRATCDWDAAETSPELRLCWEADAGDLVPGFRCGATTSSSMTGTWNRLVLTHD